MSNEKTFTLAVARVENEVQIDIVGTIGWNEQTSYAGFRQTVLDAKAKGATKARLYITSHGGSCFHANEIIDLLTDEFETIEGIGGAIVASAASYIAVRCSTFSMPENGQFMIHPPSGGEFGKAEDMEAYAEMLKNIESDYLKFYQAKANDPEAVAEILAKRTDKWLSANEAKAMGLIDIVRTAVKLDKDVQAMAQACASLPTDAFPFEINHQNDNTMNEELKPIATAFGLPATAGVSDVVAQASAVLKERDELKEQLATSKASELEAKIELKAYEDANKAEQLAQAEALIDAAIKDGRLNEKEDGSVKAAWMDNFGINHESATAMLEALPTPKRTDEQVPSATAESGAWEERQREIKEKNQ